MTTSLTFFLIVMFLFCIVMFSFINKMFECLINEFVKGRICKFVKSGVIGCYDFLVFFGVMLFGVEMMWR